MSTFEERRQRVLDAKRAGVRLTKTGKLRHKAKPTARGRYDRDTGVAYAGKGLSPKKPNIAKRRRNAVVQLAA